MKLEIEKWVEDINSVFEKSLHNQDETFHIGLLSGSMGIDLWKSLGLVLW